MSDNLKNLDIESIEILWVDCCESGSHEVTAKHNKSAMDYWQEAYTLAGHFPDNDPRYAASLNNLAVIHRLRHDFEQAEKYYQLAKNQWMAASAWVTSMEIASRAASSVFHLRMETRHRKKYNEPLVEEYLTRLKAGYAATLNNHAELLQSREHTQQARAQFALALEKRTEANISPDPALTTIDNNLHTSLDDPESLLPAASKHHGQPTPSTASSFVDRARREHWIIDKPPVFTDEGRLMAALLLSHVIDTETIP